MASLEYTNAVAYANTNAGGFVTLANSALAIAQSNMAAAGYGTVTWNPITPPGTPSVGDMPSLPDLIPPDLNMPLSPEGAGPMLGLPPLEIGSIPANTITKPVLDFGNTPSQIGLSPEAPLLDLNFTFPTPPAALSIYPTAPTFAEHTLPSSPELLTPYYSPDVPQSPDAPPTDGAQQMGRAYAEMSVTMKSQVDGFVDAYIAKHSPNYFTQMADIESQLDKYLKGGTGLAPAVEDAIYARARSKNNAEALRVRDQSLADAAARGFTMPNGALLSATQQARQGGADNNAAGAREIVVMQAEMEQKNLQFAVTTASALHDSMRNAAAAYTQSAVALNGQAMDYAKSVFANLVEMYNASLRFYSTQAEVFRTQASIFETRLRSELAKLEVFKGEIQAFEALNQADKTKSDLYVAKLNALSVLAGVFRTQVDTVVAEASLQKLKLDLFQSQVQAYGAQVQAKSSEWNGYTARISGEEAKARIYSAQLAAFGSELEAYKTTIGAKTAEIEAVSRTNAAEVGNYSARVQGYSAAVGAEVARIGAANEVNRQLVSSFQSQLAQYSADVNLELEKYRTQADAIVKNATGSLSAQVELARAKSAYGTTIAQLSNDGAQIYGQLAGSAMAGMNTLAALTETV